MSTTPPGKGCAGCRKALKAALLKGVKPENLKTQDGHLADCEEQTWPWSETSPAGNPVKRQATSTPTPTPRTDHKPQRSQVSSPDSPQQTPQTLKVVDYGSRGERLDQRKGLWFVWVVILTVVITPAFPPFLLVAAGALVTLFYIRR